MNKIKQINFYLTMNVLYDEAVYTDYLSRHKTSYNMGYSYSVTQDRLRTMVGCDDPFGLYSRYYGN